MSNPNTWLHLQTEIFGFHVACKQVGFIASSLLPDIFNKQRFYLPDVQQHLLHKKEIPFLNIQQLQKNIYKQWYTEQVHKDYIVSFITFCHINP